MHDLAGQWHRRRPARSVVLRVAALIAVLVPAAVWGAGPREEVNAAIDKLLTARSYQATMVNADNRAQQQLEHQAPGRYRIRSGGDPVVIVGDVLYRIQDGRTVRSPLPQNVLTRWRDPAHLAERAAGMDVAMLGEEAVAGVPTRKYRVDPSPAATGDLLLWIGGDGYPVQILTRTASGAADTLIRYTRFNDPTISVEPPP